VIMEIISSLDNNLVKHTVKLKQKKYRDEYGEFFVEGYKNVLDSCEASPQSVRFVVLCETAYGKCGEKFAEYKTVVTTDRVFGKIADTESSQGIVSVHTVFPSAFPESARCVFLDRVRDPGNVGTILRTAVASGYDVVLDNCADVYSPKVVRSAMSAIVKCRIGRDISIAELKRAGYEIIVADMHGENVFSSTRGEKYCIVIGNEASGVDESIVAAADRLLAVPQEGMESLNAGVAAGVMMFALRYAAKPRKN